MKPFEIRRAESGDAPLLAELRLDFMRIVKDGGLPDEEAWRRGLSAYFGRALASGRLKAWLGHNGEEVVATAALRIDRVRPGRGAAGDSDGYVMSMYTKPHMRRRGLATALLSSVIDEGRALGLSRLLLHPTEDGLALYSRLGFRAYRGLMILRLREPLLS